MLIFFTWVKWKHKHNLLIIEHSDFDLEQWTVELLLEKLKKESWEVFENLDLIVEIVAIVHICSLFP
jgi:hypothetical protein